MSATTKAAELRADIAELKQLHEKAKRKRVQDLLYIDIRKLETELIQVQRSSLESPKVPVDVPISSAPAPAVKRYQMKLNGYGWDQSDEYINVYVTLKNIQTIPKEQVYCNLTERSMVLHVDNLEDKDYVLTINNLLEPIRVEDSHWRQKTDMVVIFLAKTNQSIKWSHMTELEQRSHIKSNPQGNAIDIMKHMYRTGDDETKRMISKALYEKHQKRRRHNE